ncbi:hypothetical protein TREMEDRAFT_57378, partial [Tremella mesenterica DSM 1558]|uniref:uncharacterized protein n=1 Tax=Tremella mesenterica (strain ATCC 24925 / CBS 8224 / DSM 1558 / NBRC 9311 / NRRL Y-6157 / RJB 2259-6 / UBC 559-6) TaxID=578456 RepID=UPI0003F49369
MATQRSFIPKGFQHLEFIHANKFIAKPQPRVPGSAPKQFVQLKDRIRHWNIVPGDKVRLTVGKPTDKYNNQQDTKDGWKVHVVKSVDMERNRVYLEGVSNTKSGVFEPPPPEYHSWDADKKALWDKEHTAQKFNRPVHYSNLQLCLNDEAGPSSVFAVRIATSAPKYSTRLGRITWTRYAAKLSARTRIPLDPERNLVPIPWPSAPERKPVDALEADTIEETLLNTRTL